MPKPIKATPKPRRKRKPIPPRAYNTEFTPRGEGKEFKLNRIPSTFWFEVKRKARRDGVSLRGLVLTYLRDWKNGKIRKAA